MPDPAELLTQLLNGVVLGLIYAVIALGFMLILGTMEVINFSHGALFALGGYFALALQPHVGWWGALALAPLGRRDEDADLPAEHHELPGRQPSVHRPGGRGPPRPCGAGMGRMSAGGGTAGTGPFGSPGPGPGAISIGS